MSFSQHYHDEESRREWQNPEKILKQIGVKEGHTFVDVGCGKGFFSMPAARIVGPSGKVIGIDINERAVRDLQERSKEENLTNASFEVVRAEDAKACEGCADFVFFGIDLHDFDDPQKVLQNARGMLKSSGKLVDLDWKKKIMRKGPPVWMRLRVDEAAELIEGAGFRIESIGDSGKMHYMIIARPK